LTLEGIDEVRKQIEAIEPRELVEIFDEQYVINAPFPDLNMKGNPKGTLDNVEELLRRLRIIVRYNVISKEEEILIPGEGFTLDNKANSSFGHIVNWCVKTGISTENLSTYLTIIADRNLYNPIATWIDSKPWDGQSRLKDLYETIESTNEPIKEKLLRTWLISAVAAIYEPNGVSAHGILVLQGDQYIGKTKWFKSLVPDHLGAILDGAMLRPDDKDSVFQIISKWLVELGELDATFRKTDIAQLKAFITKSQDTIRRPYAKKESNYARRTVFFASVNEQDFLKDPTGNRRFWTISCKYIDYNHRVDMQQLWAEVKTLYQAGETWYLSHDDVKILNEHNEEFESIDPVEERVKMFFRNADQGDKIYMSPTEVCLRMGILNPTTNDVRKASAAMRKMFDAPKRIAKGMIFFVPNPRLQ